MITNDDRDDMLWTDGPPTSGTFLILGDETVEERKKRYEEYKIAKILEIIGNHDVV